MLLIPVINMTKNKMQFLFKLYSELWLFQNISLAMIASASTIFILIKFELSFAYSITSLLIDLVLLFSYLIFAESITIFKVISAAFNNIGFYHFK